MTQPVTSQLIHGLAQVLVVGILIPLPHPVALAEAYLSEELKFNPRTTQQLIGISWKIRNNPKPVKKS
jgi:hypothetical protein